MESQKTIIIGVGESEDPLPEAKKLTRYWVFAGPCKKCDCAGREILAAKSEIFLRCENCHELHSIGLSSNEFHEVTYVYWCNRSKFSSDLVVLSPEDQATLSSIEKEFLEEYEIPRWAVQVVSGRCLKAGECVNFDCVFNVPSQ